MKLAPPIHCQAPPRHLTPCFFRPRTSAITFPRSWQPALMLAFVALFSFGSSLGTATETEVPTSSSTSATDDEVKLFDGKSLEGWRVIEKFDFRGHGPVQVEEGVIQLGRGKPATGISWKSELPRSNYRITFEGQRVEGSDFFCGLTFPVKDEYCTVILGGWGGQIVGLSNIDGFSAIENETTQVYEFENGKWYSIEITVLDDRITVMIGDEKKIDLEIRNQKFSIWWEQEPVTPLGLVSWNTSAAIKNLRMVKVKPKQAAAE